MSVLQFASHITPDAPWCYAEGVERLERELAEARASIARWEAKEIHEAMACWKNNEQLKADLAAARERIVALEGTLSVRIALRREVEALLGVDPSEASEEQYAKGVAALRAVIADRAAALAEVEAAARWFYSRGAKEWREMDFAAAWSRYQQERQDTGDGILARRTTHQADRVRSDRRRR